MNYSLDLSNVTLDEFTNALNNFNSENSTEFSLASEGEFVTLSAGENVYCQGHLLECAYFWEGFLSGQAEGTTDIDPSV